MFVVIFGFSLIGTALETHFPSFWFALCLLVYFRLGASVITESVFLFCFMLALTLFTFLLSFTSSSLCDPVEQNLILQIDPTTLKELNEDDLTLQLVFSHSHGCVCGPTREYSLTTTTSGTQPDSSSLLVSLTYNPATRFTLATLSQPNPVFIILITTFLTTAARSIGCVKTKLEFSTTTQTNDARSDARIFCKLTNPPQPNGGCFRF
jgi:hypothetical protein